jgi:hypothetical protein
VDTFDTLPRAAYPLDGSPRNADKDIICVGRWLIGIALRLIGGALTRHEIDSTL